MTRRERAIERFCRERGVPRFIPTPTELALLEALEAELAADLESEETVERAWSAGVVDLCGYEVKPYTGRWDKSGLRAAIKAALETGGG